MGSDSKFIEAESSDYVSVKARVGDSVNSTNGFSKYGSIY